LVPTVSASVEVSAATKVEFSATAWVAAVVITGALSLMSVRFTAMVFAVVLTPSKADTSTA
jgi:hypothetical protein